MSQPELTGENLLAFCQGKTYATIYADPPWRFQNRTGKVAPEHKRLNRYETMELAGKTYINEKNHFLAQHHVFTCIHYVRPGKY